MQNLSQEIDLSMVLNQQSYLEERLPDFMRFENENALNAKQTYSVYENEANILKTQQEQMVLPENDKTYTKYKWEKLPFDKRIERAKNRAHIETELNDMEPIFCDKAFSFYGTYVKISEP